MRALFGSGFVPSQPVPQVSADDIERIARRDFPDDRIADVMAMLAEYGTEKWHPEPARVRLAILKLANGSLEKLRSAVDRAKRDYRDVLAPAEYPNYTRFAFHSLRLRSRERQQIYTDDWQQYQRWLRK